MSSELKHFLTSLGVACSRTSPYNPQGNGQIERLNGTLWKTIQLCLRSKSEQISNWEHVLHVALHCIRSLLCVSTNETPHERMFFHPRRSPNGEALPSWLMSPGPVLMKRNVRFSKYEPSVDEVELLEANPSYSFVRLPDGRETTVSNKQLAPRPALEDDEYEDEVEPEAEPSSNTPDPKLERVDLETDPVLELEDSKGPADGKPTGSQQQQLRRSQRVRRPASYLQGYVVN